MYHECNFLTSKLGKPWQLKMLKSINQKFGLL